jgi:hypothetical protein
MLGKVFGKLARGMALFILAMLTAAYVFSGETREPAPPVPADRIIGYYDA